MTEPLWVLKNVVYTIHGSQLFEHGGESGIRDEALLDSALQRPLNLYAYENAGIIELGTAYAWGLIQNHPFIDGNKRTAFVTSHLFLRLNGYINTASSEDKVTAFFKLASHQMTETELVEWFNRYLKSI